ncbi:uncharacterized protein EV420DRAFT_319945 [Desarmillaria tabescens]|uniref:Uncharacterized protein n=1 Tax=Armillaria tabescens TaxID=1929756 RepID=A0AA39N6P5_ARMTA|nr:uncharacterized protein EV420DRAFT_319945 [Desarmillaria tabescens]KAK0459409.1 hypothetical protein EV420DRAFT_319945 [Desarmillaria tabescens]
MWRQMANPGFLKIATSVIHSCSSFIHLLVSQPWQHKYSLIRLHRSKHIMIQRFESEGHEEPPTAFGLILGGVGRKHHRNNLNSESTAHQSSKLHRQRTTNGAPTRLLAHFTSRGEHTRVYRIARWIISQFYSYSVFGSKTARFYPRGSVL